MSDGMSFHRKASLLMGILKFMGTVASCALLRTAAPPEYAFGKAQMSTDGKEVGFDSLAGPVLFLPSGPNLSWSNGTYEVDIGRIVSLS